jgi:hypothetical protein
MSQDIKIMSDIELRTLRKRLAVNPNTFVDPAVVARLLATVERCHKAMRVASGYLPGNVLRGLAAS